MRHVPVRDGGAEEELIKEIAGGTGEKEEAREGVHDPLYQTLLLGLYKLRTEKLPLSSVIGVTEVVGVFDRSRLDRVVGWQLNLRSPRENGRRKIIIWETLKKLVVQGWFGERGWSLEKECGIKYFFKKGQIMKCLYADNCLLSKPPSP